ncbi:MAG: hypothetical protein AAF690_23885 [Acidobacteriota bacterium]
MFPCRLLLPTRPEVLVGLLLAVALPWLSSAAERPWIEARSAHFSVQGPLGEKAASDLARQLEVLHSLLAQRIDAEAPEEPTVVLAFRDSRQFRRYSPWPGAAVSAYYVRGSERSYVAVDASLRSERLANVFHEYLHVFAARHFPNMPLWFQEGLAELYSNLKVDPEQVVLGLPHRGHLARLRTQPWLPLRDVLRASPMSAAYGPAEARMFYAQSWLLVHFLGNHQQAGNQLPVLLSAVVGAEEPEVALSRALGQSVAEIEGALRRYSRRGQFDYRRIPRSDSPATAEIHAVDPADRHARLGDLLAERPHPSVARARRHFENALELDPAQRLALEGLARLQQAHD